LTRFPAGDDRPDAQRRATACHAVLDQHTAHYSEHRPRRAWSLRLPGADEIATAIVTDLAMQKTGRRRVPGGLINEYEQAA